jgi:integrase
MLIRPATSDDAAAIWSIIGPTIRAGYTAMPYQNVPAFLAEVRGKSGYGARGLELLILTTTRSAEVIGATWDEFDLDAKVWTIPPQRMKSRREHRVPLSDRAIEVKRNAPIAGFCPRAAAAVSRSGGIAHRQSPARDRKVQALVSSVGVVNYD